MQISLDKYINGGERTKQSQKTNTSPRSRGRPKMKCRDYVYHVDCNMNDLCNIARQLISNFKPQFYPHPLSKKDYPLNGFSTMRRVDLLKAIHNHYKMLDTSVYPE